MVSIFKGIVCLIVGTLLALITLIPVLLLTILKWLVPLAPARQLCTQIAVSIAEAYVFVFRIFYFALHSPYWDINAPEGLTRNTWYLIISNHQSWSDILVLVFALDGRVPFYKFFVKQELIWVPIIGAAAWAMDFPFMRRYSKQALAENPSLRTRDMEAAREFCEKLQHHPASIINYLEGTRFTRLKHRNQQSDYRHLLMPKAGGMAYVINNLGERIRTMLDVTIVYPDRRISFWRFLCGQSGRIIVDIKAREIPVTLLSGEYQQSDAYRDEFKQWIAKLWAEKDAFIDEAKNATSKH